MAYKHNNPCYDKAEDDEPIFTLRAQDMLAPILIDHWADLAKEHGCPEEKVKEAHKCASLMRAWQTSTGRAKWPD